MAEINKSRCLTVLSCTKRMTNCFTCHVSDVNCGSPADRHSVCSSTESTDDSVGVFRSALSQRLFTNLVQLEEQGGFGSVGMFTS